MKKTEIILAVIALITVFLNVLRVPGGSFLSVITISSLCLVYFPFGIALFNEIRLRNAFKSASYKGISAMRLFGAVSAGISLCIILTGILYRIQMWPFAQFNLLAGTGMTMIIIIIALIKYSTSRSAYYYGIIRRCAMIGIAGLSLLLISRNDLIDFKYRNYPRFAEALKKSLNSPNDMELYGKLEEERNKMRENDSENNQ